MEPSQPPPALPGETCPVFARLTAPARWRQVDFISDLHLQASDPATFAAWHHYMATTVADAVFVLGDLFEVWVGDDVLWPTTGQLPGFEAQCQQVLAHTARRRSVYLMHGNRDFLLGDTFASGAGATLLHDPTRLDFDAQGWLLTHGDALCLEDTAYQEFRRLVRSRSWRDDFLAKPLAERQQRARALRAQSEAYKANGQAWVDIDRATASQWLDASDASTLIHGHTHQPGEEPLRDDATALQRRFVLSDWDANTHPPRLQVLRLQRGQSPRRIRVSGF